jgi:type IV secretion system protein TrbL
MPDDVGVLTYLLNIIREILIGGVGRTDDYALWLLRQFAIIETIIFGILWAFKKSDMVEAIFKKLMMFSFILWLITNWIPFLTTLANTMTQWGFDIGNPTFPPSLFIDPSQIAAMGIDVTEPLWTYLGSLGWRNLLHGMTIGWTGIFIILSYFLMALQVFLTLVEFWIIAAASLILLPFGVLGPTAWIAEGVFKSLIGICLKILVLAMLISLGWETIATISLTNPPDFRSTMGALLASLTMAFLIWQAPNLVGGMVMGRPSLKAGGAIAGAMGGAMVFSRSYGNVRNTVRSNNRSTNNTNTNPHPSRNAMNDGNSSQRNRSTASLSKNQRSAPSPTAAPAGSRERFQNRRY